MITLSLLIVLSLYIIAYTSFSLSDNIVLTGSESSRFRTASLLLTALTFSLLSKGKLSSNRLGTKRGANLRCYRSMSLYRESGLWAGSAYYSYLSSHVVLSRR